MVQVFIMVLKKLYNSSCRAFFFLTFYAGLELQTIIMCPAEHIAWRL